MSHSRVKDEIYLSTPTIPDYGVDRLFQDSDQRHWFIKCDKCGKDTCLELEFPDCLEELAGGRVIRLCQRCRDNIIHPKDGVWLPLYADKKDLVGWRISQLNSIFVDPGKILKLYQDPPNGNISEVYNSKLARAHISAKNRLSFNDVISLCGKNPIAESDPGSCYLGCDVGSMLHVVIGKNDKQAGRIVYIGAFPEWEHLYVLMRKFNVIRGVIDALPETRLARKFAEDHRGKIFCCFYQEMQKGVYAWNEKQFTVAVNRTESLDASHAEIAKGEIVLPRECETLHEFARHLSNVGRVLQTDPDTGASRYVYLKTGPDHYRHALNYEAMARNNAPDLLFPNL